MKDKATGFRVIVRPQQGERESAGGIVKFHSDDEGEAAQRANDVGEVVDIGPAAFQLDRFGNDSPIKVGDKIRFKQYAGHLFRYKDSLDRPTSEFYQIINDDDVLTIIEESEDV